MGKDISIFLAIGILNFLLFAGMFKLLQNEKIYLSTLGHISRNYECFENDNELSISRVSKPYSAVTNSSLLNWDAGIYKCISERLYRMEDDCNGQVRAAFFPLFPLLWRISHATPLLISIMNYMMFIISIALLMKYLFIGTDILKISVFALLITLPSVVSYYIPYSEALFLLTMTIAVIGFVKKKYLLYFIGLFLLALVRPAALFVMIAFLLAEIVSMQFLNDKKAYIRSIAKTALPFAIGTITAIFIQFLSSNSWDALIQARKHWPSEGNLADGFRDWSVEGFGLSLFAIVFVCLPALLFILQVIKKSLNKKNQINKVTNDGYFLAISSAFYFLGIAAFILNTQGFNLHSFSRYILASPPFYIGLILLLNYSKTITAGRTVIAFGILVIILVILFESVSYGGAKIQFPYAGLFLFVLSAFALFSLQHLSHNTRWVIVILVVLLNTVWNTYMFNSFISSGWVFT